MQQPTPIGPPPPGFAPPGQKLNSLALISLICGILTWVMLPIVGALAAVITGHLARREIQRTGEDGATFALIGLISGYVHLALGAIVIILLIVVFGGLLLVSTSTSH